MLRNRENDKNSHQRSTDRGTELQLKTAYTKWTSEHRLHKALLQRYWKVYEGFDFCRRRNKLEDCQRRPQH